VAKQCRVANVWIHQLKILFVHRTYSEIKIYMYKSQLYTIYSTVYQYMYRSRLHNTIGLNRKAQLKCTTIHTNNSSIISSWQRYRYNQRKLCWQRSSSFMWSQKKLERIRNWRRMNDTCVCNKIPWEEESPKGSVTHTITIKQLVTWESICHHNYAILCKAAHIITGPMACLIA